MLVGTLLADSRPKAVYARRHVYGINPFTAYWRFKTPERQQVLPLPPGGRNCRVATANFEQDWAEALRRPIAGTWLTMGRPFSFDSAIVAPGPPSDNTGVLKRVNTSALI